MAGIWIFAEKREYVLELLNISRQTAAKMGCGVSVILASDREKAQDYLDRGAEQVILLPDLQEDQSIDAYIPALADEARKEDPDVILFAATARGKELAARLSVRLDAGLCSQCLALAYDDAGKTLEMERLAYGGAAVQRVRCLSRPIMATIPPRTFEPADVAEAGKKGEVKALAFSPCSPVKVLERKAKQRESKDITEAKIVVSVGRGLAKAEDMIMMRQLADALGAEIGGTRPITEELHWLPEEACIGLSGVQVKPDLFLALGVSGQIQHVTGIRGAKVICAVNRDENAPIFGVADFGMVGDLYDVVPKLLQALKA
jgi:electron transfer flavoprotein alpha subunit